MGKAVSPSGADLVRKAGAVSMVTLLSLVWDSCSGAGQQQAPIERPPPPVFTEIALSSGIDFQHVNGSTGRFYYPEAYFKGVGYVG